MSTTSGKYSASTALFKTSIYPSTSNVAFPVLIMCNQLTWTVTTNRGTAYIIYFDTSDAEAAIAHMHEAQVDGAVISVSVVLPRRKFSRSPPPARRGVPTFERFDPRGPFSGGYRGGPPPPSYGGPSNGRYRSSPPLRRVSPLRRYAGRPGPRDRDFDTYRPRSYSRSRSPRIRSRSLSSRSRSRTPVRRNRGVIRRESPPPRGGRRRRSPSYSSFSSFSDRSRSRSRGRYGRGKGWWSWNAWGRHGWFVKIIKAIVTSVRSTIKLPQS